MKPLTLLVLLIAGGALAACSSDPVAPDPGPDTNTTHSNPAFAYIGFGYDLTLNWADQDGVRGIVFDAEKLPGSFTETKTLEQATYDQITGSSIEEYEGQMAAGISLSGSYKYFSGAVRANFAESHYRYSGRSFSTLHFNVAKSRTDVISNYATVDHLRQYMTTAARQDLDGTSMSPDDIFRLYGTHVMTGAIMGARLDYSASMETSKIMEGSEFGAMVRAGYKSLFGSAELTASFRTLDEERQFSQNSSVKILAYGGRSEFAWSDSSFSLWRHSIDANRVWMKFTEAGLIPIWEFCTNESRKSAIRDYLTTWIEKRRIKVEPPDLPPPPPELCIIDIFTSGSDYAPTINRNGLLYRRLDANLNVGAGSNADAVYLYYALGFDSIKTGDRTPITDLRLGLSTSSAGAKNEAAAGGYTWVGVDLNEGVGGAFIWLGVHRQAGARPVRALAVYDRTTSYTAYSDSAAKCKSYFDVPSRVGPLDLNRGAGGHSIYLLYAKE